MPVPELEALAESIQRGKALLRTALALSAGLGRRTDDQSRPEIVQARELFGVLVRWDRTNEELIARLEPTRPELLARYRAIEQPDKQLFITDFGSVRARVADGITRRIAFLEGLAHDGGGARSKECAFLGHGRAPTWREVGDFLERRLGVAVAEFNREPAASLVAVERIESLLDRCTVAIAILTAEDRQPDGSVRARENVVHELGLFQGRLGRRRTIALVEEGCELCSNLAGIQYVGFPSDRVSASFEELRRVLEREGIVRPAA